MGGRFATKSRRFYRPEVQKMSDWVKFKDDNFGFFELRVFPSGAAQIRLNSEEFFLSESETKKLYDWLKDEI